MTVRQQLHTLETCKRALQLLAAGCRRRTCLPAPNHFYGYHGTAGMAVMGIDPTVIPYFLIMRSRCPRRRRVAPYYENGAGGGSSAAGGDPAVLQDLDALFARDKS